MSIKEVNKLVEAAIHHAERDWENHAVRHLFNSYRGASPTLNIDSGFYSRYFTDVNDKFVAYGDDCDSDYCRAYNQRIEELVASNGLPEWAPARRLPSRQEALSILSNLAPSEVPYENLKEKKVISYIQRNQSYQPSLYVRDKDRRLLLMGGDINQFSGEVNIIDLDGPSWMSSYQYLRKHQPNFPWDSIENSVI
jgi:hypothetical protein